MIKFLFIQKNQNIYAQLFRFICVGVSSFLIDMGILVFLTEVLGVYYILSATISFIIALTYNYLLTSSWVFNKSRLKSKYWEIFIYVSLAVLGLLLNDGSLYFLTELFDIHYMISKLVVTMCVMVFNFATRKMFLFQ